MKRSFFEQGYYHIYNRGALKQVLFIDNKDYCRFILLILGLQGDFSFRNISRIIKNGDVSEVIKYLDEHIKEIQENKKVEILNFCLMPNHFHLTIHEIQEGGVSSYMHKLLNAYSHYFNQKYNKTGHVFQGPYKCLHVLGDSQNYYLSAYIHSNPREIYEWKSDFLNYPWSSYQDYAQSNRWGQLLENQFILEAHPKKDDYKKFVEISGAKLDKLV